jgi:hypothetical protein
MLYMDEVAGYLPPTATPPTKKPIMTLMKQARAFGVGVVLSTQNPVDVDYKALSNAGTWMIGRLQTDRDKQRLLDGMSAASGGVDVKAVGDTISGLGKREFMLRRAGKDQPEVFTTRWAMSYLRGPLTRDQISVLMAPQKGAQPAPVATAARPAPPAGMALPPPPAGAAPLPPPVAVPNAAPTPMSATLEPDATTVMPEIADGIPVRWADVASPWLAEVGADARGTRWEAAVLARVALRFDDEKADFVADEEFEAVLFPLKDPVDASQAVAVDYDDRDLQSAAPPACVYVLPDAAVKTKAWFARVERDLVDHLVRSRSVDLLTNKDLKLFGRPGEAADAFAVRCTAAAGEMADAEIAKLRSKYETKFASLRTQLQTAEGRANVLDAEAKGRRNDELFSAAGSILGGLFGGKSRTRMIDQAIGGTRSAVTKRSRTQAAGSRLDATETKLQALHQQLDDLEDACTAEVTAINDKWMASAGQVSTVAIGLERLDVKVTQRALVWLPVP